MAMLNIVTVGICINTIIIMLNNYLLQAGDTVRLTALLASDTRSQVGLISVLFPFHLNHGNVLVFASC